MMKVTVEIDVRKLEGPEVGEGGEVIGSLLVQKIEELSLDAGDCIYAVHNASIISEVPSDD